MVKQVKKFRGLMAVLLLATLAMVQLPGCGGGGGSGTMPTGTLKVGLTDKLSDDFAAVFVTIKEVRVVPAGLENAADTDSRLPVIATFSNPQPRDILKLRFVQELLGEAVLPAGRYNQVRLILEPNPPGQQDPLNYLTLKTAETVKIPLKTPSAQQSGLKVVGQYEVKAGLINAILLDFDPNTAIVDRGNGDYNLKPTGIRIIQTASLLSNFGSLSGNVISTLRNWSTATVSVVPQGSAGPIAAGSIFSNLSGGRYMAPFTSFVPAGSYRVHVRANGFVPYSSPVTPVIPASDSGIGDVVLVTQP